MATEKELRAYLERKLRQVEYDSGLKTAWLVDSSVMTVFDNIAALANQTWNNSSPESRLLRERLLADANMQAVIATRGEFAGSFGYGSRFSTRISKTGDGELYIDGFDQLPIIRAVPASDRVTITGIPLVSRNRIPLVDKETNIDSDKMQNETDIYNQVLDRVVFGQ